MAELIGILNLTPDSFSDGGRYVDPDLALLRAGQMFADGAAIVDVGAESTRPNAAPISDDEEWRRLEPVLGELMAAYPGRISLDTYRPATADSALRLGSVIINDVTGFSNPRMQAVISEHQPGVIISHLPTGMTIAEAHAHPHVSSVDQVREELLARAELLRVLGVDDADIIVDPGIGFGKTNQLNEKLLEFGDQISDYAVVIGYSRKRFLGEGRMELGRNLEAGRVAVQHGATYLRVHDVAGHRELVTD